LDRAELAAGDIAVLSFNCAACRDMLSNGAQILEVEQKHAVIVAILKTDLSTPP